MDIFLILLLYIFAHAVYIDNVYGVFIMLQIHKKTATNINEKAESTPERKKAVNSL